MVPQSSGAMWIAGSATISGCTIANSTAAVVRQLRRTWRSAYPRVEDSRRDILATCLYSVLLATSLDSYLASTTQLPFAAVDRLLTTRG